MVTGMLTIAIDGNEVTLTGSRKGDGVLEALRGTAWKWSRPVGGFVLPRNLLPHTRERNVKAAQARLTAAGFEVEVKDTGTVLSVAEEREKSEQRLTERAARYEHTAERRGAEAEGRYTAEHALLDPIPFGQPNIGGRLTSVYKRAEQHRVAAREAEKIATDAARRAEGIQKRLDSGTPTRTLLLRIERYEAELRDIQRRLDGSGAARYGTHQAATGEYRERLLAEQARTVEALDLDRAELDRRQAENGVTVWGPEHFQKGDEVGYWGGWAVVKRVNKKSLTVPSGYSWDQTVRYDAVKARRRDGEVTR